MKILTFFFFLNFFSIIFVLFTILLVLFSSSNLASAKNGLYLWANNIIPALFPFFIATELLSHTNVIAILGKFFNKFMRPLFNVPGEGSYPLIMGIVSGYPVGAKIVCDLRNKNILTKPEAERLLAFTNNSGPLFILGTIGIGLFKDTTTGIILLVTHILASLTVGIIFRFWKYKSKTLNSQNNVKSNVMTISFANLGEVLAQSITSSLSTIFMIGGFVVIFSSIISILNSSGIQNIALLIFSPLFNFLNI